MAPQSPDEWRSRLLAKLASRRRRAQGYLDYYDGDHPMPRLDAKQRAAFRGFFRESRANWVALVVDAVSDRLAITGFRFGDSLDADGDAWAIWQASHLDADHQLVNVDALTVGSTFVSVWPDETNPSGVLIAAETPLETVVQYRPGSRWDRTAALKAWYDDDEDESHAILFFADAVFKWATRGNIHDAASGGQRVLGA